MAASLTVDFLEVEFFEKLFQPCSLQLDGTKLRTNLSNQFLGILLARCLRLRRRWLVDTHLGGQIGECLVECVGACCWSLLIDVTLGSLVGCARVHNVNEMWLKGGRKATRRGYSAAAASAVTSAPVSRAIMYDFKLPRSNLARSAT